MRLNELFEHPDLFLRLNCVWSSPLPVLLGTNDGIQSPVESLTRVQSGSAPVLCSSPTSYFSPSAGQNISITVLVDGLHLSVYPAKNIMPLRVHHWLEASPRHRSSRISAKHLRLYLAFCFQPFPKQLLRPKINSLPSIFLTSGSVFHLGNRLILREFRIAGPVELIKVLNTMVDHFIHRHNPGQMPRLCSSSSNIR